MSCALRERKNKAKYRPCRTRMPISCCENLSSSTSLYTILAHRNPLSSSAFSFLLMLMPVVFVFFAHSIPSSSLRQQTRIKTEFPACTSFSHSLTPHSGIIVLPHSFPYKYERAVKEKGGAFIRRGKGQTCTHVYHSGNKMRVRREIRERMEELFPTGTQTRHHQWHVSLVSRQLSLIHI